MNEFHFIRPWWFFALIPLIIILWQLNRRKHNDNGWHQVMPAHLVKHLIQGDEARRHQPFWLLAVAWLMAVVALTGPTWEKLPQPVFQTNTGKVLLMDMSQSMFATDLKPNRLTKARYKAMDLVAKIDDTDIGLVAYSGDAFVISPLTADSKNLTALIPSLSPDIMPVTGSNLVAGLALASDLLKNAGYSRGEIYLLTDGIDQLELPDVKEYLKGNQHRLSILGVGTADGAPIKLSSGELLKDSRGSIVVPRLIDSRLRGVAKSTGGVYTRITNGEMDIDFLSKQEALSREAKKNEEDQLHQGDQYKEVGPLIVMILLPFAAYAFRRGLVVCLVLGFSLMLMPSSYASEQNPKQNNGQIHADERHADNPASQPSRPVAKTASDNMPKWWQNLWQTQDQQAADQYANQNYADAAQTFKDSQWRGSSLYRSGDYEAALEQFQKSNTADGLYNQGNALAKMQQYDAAIDAYKKALEKQPDMTDAQKNLELLEKLKQQEQQNQDQQQSDEQNQDQQNQEQQDGDQNQQQQQQGDESQDQQDSQSEQESGQQDQQGEEQEQEQQKPDPRDAKDGQDKNNDPQASEQQQEQGEEQKQANPEQQEPGEEESDKQLQQLEQAEDGQSQEEKEQMQEIQLLMRKIPDDPSILLRNKMRIEYQKRKNQNRQPPGAKSW